jgi:hypothetical protein
LKNYPTRDKCIFLLCDDIRLEAGGKFSLMGWFPDGIVLTEPAPGAPPGGNLLSLPGLSVAVAFLDGVGEYKARVQVNAPDGAPMLPLSNEVPVTKREGLAMTLHVRITPFASRSFGQFTVRVSLDDHEYIFTFHVRPLAQQLAPGTVKH